MRFAVGGEDQDVVQVRHAEVVQQPTEGLVDVVLEGGRCVS